MVSDLTSSVFSGDYGASGVRGEDQRFDAG